MYPDWLDAIPELPQLAAGQHNEGSGQLCAMEMVAFMERLPHSDHPDCTCPTLALVARTLNDMFLDPGRAKLMPVLPLLVDTRNPALEHERQRFHAEQALLLLRKFKAVAPEYPPIDMNYGRLNLIYGCVHVGDREYLENHLIDILKQSIFLDPKHQPKVWAPERIEELKEMA